MSDLSVGNKVTLFIAIILGIPFAIYSFTSGPENTIGCIISIIWLMIYMLSTNLSQNMVRANAFRQFALAFPGTVPIFIGITIVSTIPTQGWDKDFSATGIVILMIGIAWTLFFSAEGFRYALDADYWEKRGRKTLAERFEYITKTHSEYEKIALDIFYQIVCPFEGDCSELLDHPTVEDIPLKAYFIREYDIYNYYDGIEGVPKQEYEGQHIQLSIGLDITGEFVGAGFHVETMGISNYNCPDV